ncbi:hypothetical protein EVAR_38562_1 [Eumeta japonica]|uniref:Uncharacterized protein n=1 Tax=Eumeta variegata TaxID=151549 RepID=A0A4C1WSG7_EUMVA|nr:hypothetical protein EVAR_38562_1 [Eumeta japonica]
MHLMLTFSKILPISPGLRFKLQKFSILENDRPHRRPYGHAYKPLRRVPSLGGGLGGVMSVAGDSGRWRADTSRARGGARSADTPTKPLCDFLAKGCTNTGWLYKLPSLLIQNRIYTPPDIYAPFGVSGLVPFSHCDWLKVER